MTSTEISTANEEKHENKENELLMEHQKLFSSNLNKKNSSNSQSLTSQSSNKRKCLDSLSCPPQKSALAMNNEKTNYKDELIQKQLEAIEKQNKLFDIQIAYYTLKYKKLQDSIDSNM